MTRMKPFHFEGFAEQGRTFRAEKKPVEVEVFGPVNQRWQIQTREGTVVAEPGDYIIQGVEGEIYPIGAEIFDDTYRVVEE